MKLVKIISIILLVVFVGIQFIPTTRNLSKDVSNSDFMVVFDVPKNIESKLKVSCYDCHSNNTYYPWYNKIQPVAWFLEDHINEGKAELNFSTFGEYSKRRQKSKLKSIMSQITDDEMPLESYTLIHSDAKLSKEDKKEVVSWIETLVY
ncbi:heme-binding domain-containing protein [Mariniflexile sp. AS56]|uniref:heme-binding domain-containing protein n=1 Tax=Mariniflexile sp. AS56 TaxID=3063957 RepID=UPI0026F092B6|nr:heme-binding domain-containing protein [Mariniflexile sp. AS56]MDO7171129.1 heme-binding domain-containing protein [Mariniflexile sp. AS56]